MTLGDVLAAVGGLIALCVCTWALYIALALLAVQRTSLAADAILQAPWKSGFLGLVVLAVGLPLSIVLWRLPQTRLLSVILTLAMLMLSALGGAGLVVLAARRLRALDPSVTPYTALCRAAAFVVTPSLLPILGWFLIGPSLFAVGLGAGIRSLRTAPVAQGFAI